MKQIITKTIDIQGLKKGISIGLGIILALGTSAILAVAVTGTINTFSSGNVVDATQMNTNFTSLKTAIEGITSSQWTSSGSNIYYNAGNIGIGSSSPVTKLDVNGSIFASGYTNSPGAGKGLEMFYHTGLDMGIIQSYDYGGGGVKKVALNPSGGNVGIGTTSPTALLHVAGTAGNTSGTWSSLSDERLKKNIFDYKGSLEKVLNLRPVSFEWKENKDGKTAGRHIGFIAQEVEKIFPEWVSTMSDGNKWMTPEGMNAVLVQSIRELKERHEKEIASVKTQHTASQKENARLREEIKSLTDSVRTHARVSGQLEERLNALERMQLATARKK